MEIATVFWSADLCADCSKDVREITLVETIDGEVVETLILECSDAGCVSRAWERRGALAA